MEHPYRVHSSIGLGFLHLLMLSSLAYPSPPPPIYQNIALLRMMGIVYFTIFSDKPIYLKLECITILLEVIRDILYIWYIIQDYTYIFGVFDIVSNLLFCTVVVLSINNGEDRWERINNTLEGIRTTCFGCCCDVRSTENNGSTIQLETRSQTPNHIPNHGHGHMYTSLPTCEMKREDEPIYTFGGRQAFKPNFYSSSWGREYLNEKVNREFDKINFRENTTNGDVGMVTSPDGQTQYIRFDEVESTSAAGSHHYANLFVSPYMTKDGTPITSFSDWTKKDTIGVCLLIYNIIQFIYQLMMYNSIIKGCQGYHVTGDSAIGDTISHERLMRWLC